MGALSKASSIGPPQGPWTPLPHGGDAPLMQLMHALMGNARQVSGPNGRYPAMESPQDLMGLVGGGIEPVGGGPAGPIARFLAWQPGAPEKGIPHMPLYNVEGVGHPLHRSTVSAETLAKHGIAVPETPSIESLNPQLGPKSRPGVIDARGVEPGNLQGLLQRIESSPQGAQGRPAGYAKAPLNDDQYAQALKKFGGRGGETPMRESTPRIDKEYKPSFDMPQWKDKPPKPKK